MHLAIPISYLPHSSMQPWSRLGLKTKHWRMVRLQHFSVPQIHMHATWQTRIEAPHRTHDVDSLELVRTVFFEDRSVLYRVLVRTRSAVNVTRIGIPGRRRIRVIVGDLAFFDHDVVRKNAAHRFVEAAADGLLWNLELSPGFGVSRMQFRQRLFHKVQSSASRVDLEVRPCTVAFDGIAPLGNLPLELNLRQRSSLRQIHLDAVAGGLDVADVDQPSQRGGPEAGDGAASGIHRQMIASSLIEPARRHHPGIFPAEVTLLWPRNRGLIPGMVLVHRIA